MDPINALTGILLAPLIASGAIVSFALRQARVAATISLVANAVALGLTFWLLQSQPLLPLEAQWAWLELHTFTLSMGYYVTPQALLMLFIVTFLGFWIQLFSTAYMREDPSQGRYFAGLSIFLFAMLGIVLADNLFMMFIFWELVGLGSYLLIAHYWKTEAAAQASKKAFIVNRIGDWGFLLGIVGCFWHYGTTNIAQLQTLLAAHPEVLSGGLALLLMCGFLGKSAQLPLQVWLPDAMAGPTPVSALIHAATMVAAGIYFLCRAEFLFPDGVRSYIACLGSIMALYAGICALTQRDIKRVLAYSTLSQLGYMACVFGLGYSGLALMHLSTHAFFKALLFLGAGALIAQTHHEQDIFSMGGLLRRMPFTAVVFAVGSLALIGAGWGNLLISSGGASKHLILEAAWLQSPGHYWTLWVCGFITALYTGRLFWLVFLGEPRQKATEHAQEASWVMLLPLFVLTLYSVFVGFRYLMPTGLAAVFDADILRVHADVQKLSGPYTFSALHILPSFAWIAGLALSLFFKNPVGNRDRLETAAPGLHHILSVFPKAFDTLYQNYLVKPKTALAYILHFMDMLLLRTVAMGSLKALALVLSSLLRRLNTGNLRTYAHWTLGGLATLAALASLF